MFDFGLVFNALITFVITAAVVYFLIVAPMRRIAARRQGGEEPVAELSSQEQLLTEIRDLLADGRQGVPAQRTPNAPTRAES